jgi:hypothetical protein
MKKFIKPVKIVFISSNIREKIENSFNWIHRYYIAYFIIKQIRT